MTLDFEQEDIACLLPFEKNLYYYYCYYYYRISLQSPPRKNLYRLKLLHLQLLLKRSEIAKLKGETPLIAENNKGSFLLIEFYKLWAHQVTNFGKNNWICSHWSFIKILIIAFMNFIRVCFFFNETEKV